jgi:8-oxo-dGTP pyrophosphatase MutT (NUDIX family)
VTDVPRPSSTIVLLREAEGAPQVLMVHRHARTAFGNNYAYPGGVLDRCDCEVHARCAAPSARDADRLLGVEQNGLDYYSAAIRELFEETGVLLARKSDGQSLSGDPATVRELHELRTGLNAGRISWAELLREHDFLLATDGLEYFAHWITPVSEPKRFSTRFFMAQAPDGQEASHDGAELIDSRWMTAREVLRAGKSGEIKLIFATYKILLGIADLGSAGEVMAWAREVAAAGVAAVRPAIVQSGGRQRVVLPGDPEYPDEHGH